MFDTDPSLWISVAAMQFEGPAARWFQAVQKQLDNISWDKLCQLVLVHFGRNQHQTLIRKLYRLVQTGSVEDYFTQFSELVDQLSAYEIAPDALHYTTRFIDGLRPSLRMFVAIQQPSDLDIAYLLATLQEEVGDGVTPINVSRRAHPLPAPSPCLSIMPPPSPDTAKASSSTSPTEDRLAGLRAYRRAKGLCFTCGERWARDHQCKQTV
jgi:hypothetical protein